MAEYITKVVITTAIIIGITELGKSSHFWGSILASLPITSLLAFIWIFWDTGDAKKIIELSYGIFWIIIPSLILFICLPLLLKKGLHFWLALPLSSLATVIGYFVYIRLLKVFGINI
jgi:hypothetical protein